MKTEFKRKTTPITAEEISEMEKMLTHLHFTINKTIPVKVKMTHFPEQYNIKNKRCVGVVLSEKGIIKKFGNKNGACYLWSSSVEPNKMMARRIIESVKKRQRLHCENSAKRAALKVSNSVEQITREEFEKTLHLKDKEVKSCKPQPKHVEPIQKQETESVSLFWGLYTRTKNI